MDSGHCGAIREGHLEFMDLRMGFGISRNRALAQMTASL